MSEPVIWWVRKDLRLGDNAALMSALELGRPVIPVFILDEVFSTYGAAPLWRFGLGVQQLAQDLAALGSRLILRRGPAAEVLAGLCSETGAKAVRWSRAYDPDQVARDRAVKATLDAQGVDAKSLSGHLLFEPWAVETKDGGFYKVYSAFWRAVRGLDVGTPLDAPSRLPSPDGWPTSDQIGDWGLDARMRRGAPVVAAHLRVGAMRALERLDRFIADRIGAYKERRDFPGEDATSGLSENLAWGEISPRQCWVAGLRAMEEGAPGAEHFLKELVWREFAYHLVWHTPHILTENWRAEWNGFPWRTDPDASDVLAWRQGRTGVPFVDAGLREMYVTGRMHNRARMVVASYLTKHMLCDWRIGQAWFEDCLTDWDPASNAMGWQWVAGSGPDAAPYFRVFNPETQLDKFDKDGVYRKRWIAEGQAHPGPEAASYFDAVPKGWGLSQEAAYPTEPIVPLADGRTRALAAYQDRKG